MFKKTSTSSGYRDPEVLVGLDLGTSKITVVVAERDRPSGEAQIIGMGQAPSRGIRKGLIVHLDQAIRSVKQAVSDAENMVGIELTEATVAFSGGDVHSVRSKGMISLGRSPRTVQQFDVGRVIDVAQADVPVHANQMILHTIPVEYSLDGNSGIDDPMGMNGMRLDIDLESVIVPSATVQNVFNCADRAGLNVTGFVIKPLASALGALSPEESGAGVVSVDIGGGTSGIAVFAENRPKHLAIISVGGDHITNDVASVLKIPIGKAEELKREVDLSSNDSQNQEDRLEFDHNGRNYLYSLSEFTEIVQCRVEELFAALVKGEIANSGVLNLPAGIVLTGGVARSEGIEHYLSRVMDMPVRVAMPLDSNRMPPQRNGPEYTCASGIIRYVLEQERDPFRYIEQPMDQLKIPNKSGGRRVIFPPQITDEDKAKKTESSIWQSITDAFKDLF